MASSSLDVLVVGDGVGARLLAHVLEHLRLRVARLDSGGDWMTRSIALPESTVRELGFLGLERSNLERFLVPEVRRPTDQHEDIWIIDEATLVGLMDGEREPPDVRQGERPPARITVMANQGFRSESGWVEAVRLHLQAARFETERQDGHPAHAFLMEPGRWVWAVEEEGASTVLLTLATVLEEGAAPIRADDITESLRAHAASLNVVAGDLVDSEDTVLSAGVSTQLGRPDLLAAGPAQVGMDPITALGLRAAVRAAIRTGIACRALLEGRLPAECILEWHATATPLEAAAMLAQALWLYRPPAPGVGPLAEQLVPDWARPLPDDLRTALGRKLVTPFLMKTQRFLETPLAAAVDAGRHAGVEEVGGRLEVVERLGCPILGLLPRESAATGGLQAAFSRSATPIEVLESSPGVDEQALMLSIIRLLDAGIITPLEE